ncbi:MAG: amidohydrolase/deacetylase family metallohydrolase [Pikeienuella sp.]
MKNHELVLKGGRVIDPANNIDRITDIAFSGGTVSAVGDDLDGKTSRDVSGQIVTPGLIDLHTHVYWGGTSLGIDPDEFMRNSAVTTAIDTGSAGPGNFAGFRKHVIEPAKARILAFLHISHAGIFGFSNRIMVGESENLSLMDPVTAVEVAKANPDVIVGIKVRLGLHASSIHGAAPLGIALQVAEESGLPLMVHIDEPPPTYAEVVSRLRPGDILTHCFRAFPNAPVDGKGRIRAEVWEARRRGVIFDIGHGMASFSYKTARAALADGFAPDCISSDVHQLCIGGPAYDQVTTLSKFLALDMTLPDVIAASTIAPARALRRPELGSLTPGGPGDASILSLEDGSFDLEDVLGEIVTAPQMIRAKAVVRAGEWIECKGHS